MPAVWGCWRRDQGPKVTLEKLRFRFREGEDGEITQLAAMKSSPVPLSSVSANEEQ